MKPKLLDLFCGAGGAARGYKDVGFHVTGVDIVPQPRYCGDTHWQFDVMKLSIEYLRRFDVIHASPPCQAYTEVSNDKSVHSALIAPVRDLLRQVGLPYVIENVKGAKNAMKNPILLCGSTFGLRVRKHRYFESNVRIPQPACVHSWQNENRCFDVYEHRKWRKTGIVPVYGEGGGKSNEFWPSAMGCGTSWNDCWMRPEELREAIPPAYTRYVGQFLLNEFAFPSCMAYD